MFGHAHKLLLLSPPLRDGWVWGVCVRQREMVVYSPAHGWVRGLLLNAQLSLLIMSISNQCKRRQEPKWHFSTLNTHVSFVVKLSFIFIWCHAAPICSHFASGVLPSVSIWFHSYGDAQWDTQARETQNVFRSSNQYVSDTKLSQELNMCT